VSIPVELPDLAAAIAGRTAQAYLVSIRDERPHVVSVTPTVRDDGTLVVGAGRRTSLNIAERPEVTLLWPTDDADPKHSLLVDGTATARPGADDDDTLTITPTSAILHRVRTR
jgi:hypothetical protein